MRKIYSNIALALFCYPILGFSQVETLTEGSATLDGVVASEQPAYSRNMPGQLRLEITLGCYGVNLRNPAGTVNLSGGALVPLQITVLDQNNNPVSGTMNIPAQAFKVNSTANTNVAVVPASLGTARVQNNSLTSNWAVATDTGTVNAAGEVDIVRHAMKVRSVTFGNGVRMDNLSKSMSQDGRTLRITAKVPSAVIGECGSFVSPLMVFFDESRPKFSAVTEFALGQPEGMGVHWPEKGAKGFFLGLDARGDGIIKDANQLFGSYDSPNGFEKLKALDSNKDGQINSSDAAFSKLVLWRDKNSNGKTDKGDEYVSLKDKGIKSISLSYSSQDVVSYGHGAEGRERSTFVWLDKNNKEHSGVVEDIWFNTAPLQNRRLASTSR
jgi:hypothetical protein